MKSESLIRCLLVPWYFPCCYRFYYRAVTLATGRQTPIDITKFLHVIFSLAGGFFSSAADSTSNSGDTVFTFDVLL